MSISKVQRWSLYIYFFSVNFDIWDPLNTNGAFSISKLTGLIYFFSILPEINYFLSVKDLKVVLKPIWLFFALLTIVSLLHINFFSSSFFDFSIFQNIVLLWILINHKRKEKNVLEEGMFSFALGSIVLSFCYFLGIGVEYDIAGRVSLFGGNSNSIGMQMCISIAIVILAVIQNQFELYRYRLILLACIPFMLKLLAESGSRVAFTSFVLMFSFGVILLKTKKTWYKIVAFVIGSIVFALMIQYILNSSILVNRLLQTVNEGDLAGRDEIWQELQPLILGNPLFGVGKTGYAEYSQKVFSGLKSPHNVIIEILCYVGAFGFIAYFLFFIRVIKLIFKSYKKTKILLPPILIFPIFGFILSGQILTSKIGWIIFSYSIASGLFLVQKPEIQKSTLKYF